MQAGISRDDVSTLREEGPADVIPLRDEEVEIPSNSPRKKTAFKERLPVIIPVTITGILLLCLFWCAACWIFGKVYQVEDHLSRLHILTIDLDGGNIGTSLTTAVESLTGLKTQLSYDIPTKSYSFDSAYAAVRAGNEIWGAIIANPGASENLTAAISAGDTSLYNASSALTIIYNEARFATVEAGDVYGNLQTAAATTAVVYQKLFGEKMLSELAQRNGSAVAAVAGLLMDPVSFETVNIQSFGFGIRVLLNTVGQVFPAISGFFFVMAVNGISAEAGIWRRWGIVENWIVRVSFATVYTLLFSLSWTSWVYIFKNGGDLDAGQFFLIWMTLWLAANIHFHTIDTVNAAIPMKFMPFFVLSWIILGVSSSLFPSDLASRFYKVDYFFPANHTWGVLMTILGRGANNHLKIDLPTLFGWLIVSACGGFWGNRKRVMDFRKQVAAVRKGVEDEEKGAKKGEEKVADGADK
ncbi:hypothetical protein RUND412_010425 [Rhizina undulata]